MWEIIGKHGRIKSLTGFSEGDIMLKEMKYGALSGKSRAMFGKLLNRYDYNALIQKKRVSEILAYLKYNTHYSTILAEVDENNVHRVDLENALKKDIMTDYSKFRKFAVGQLKEFINVYFRKIEIESLKLILRAFEAGHVEYSVLEKSLMFLTGNDGLDIPKLALSKDLEEFLSRLYGTDYYELLKPFLYDSDETRLFDMEMTLDLYYIRCLKKAFERLPDKTDRAIVKEMMETEADILNILWIYRSKYLHEFPNELIRSYLVHITGKLGRKMTDSLINAGNTEEYLDILKRSPYGFLFDDQNQLFFEHSYLEYIHKLHRTYFRRRPFSVACIISYLRLKELEIANIITIIECIRYGLSEEETRKFVIGMNL